MNTEKKHTVARSLRSLRKTYGAPAFYNEKTGQLKRLNEHYWAARLPGLQMSFTRKRVSGNMTVEVVCGERPENRH